LFIDKESNNMKLSEYIYAMVIWKYKKKSQNYVLNKTVG
jgi:hypothetical protein